MGYKYYAEYGSEKHLLLGAHDSMVRQAVTYASNIPRIDLTAIVRGGLYIAENELLCS